MNIEQLSSLIKDNRLRLIWLLCTSLIAWLSTLGEKGFFVHILSSLSAPILAKITLSLSVLVFSLSASLFILWRDRQKIPSIKDYEHILHPGIMKHKKSGKYYCQPCLLKGHITCELSVINKDELFCHCCKSSYKIDHAVLISDTALSRTWDDAIKEHTSEDK